MQRDYLQNKIRHQHYDKINSIYKRGKGMKQKLLEMDMVQVTVPKVDRLCAITASFADFIKIN